MSNPPASVPLESLPASVDERRSVLLSMIDSEPGYAVVPGAVPDDVLSALLRRLNLEIVRTGLSAEDIASSALATFFPHLRWEPEILSVRSYLEQLVPAVDGEQWGDAQILLRFPDEAETWDYRPHVDARPPWAPERPYTAIFGVALSRSSEEDGCLAAWPLADPSGDGEPAPVELDAGDVVLMSPSLPHTSTLNRGGAIRYVVYYRLLSAA